MEKQSSDNAVWSLSRLKEKRGNGKVKRGSIRNDEPLNDLCGETRAGCRLWNIIKM